jgi:hypothetical protein
MEIANYRFPQEWVNKQQPKVLVCVLQRLIGQASSSNNDRNPDRQQNVDEYMHRAHDLCIKIAARWEPVYSNTYGPGELNGA